MTAKLKRATFTAPFQTIDQAPLKIILLVRSSFVQEITYCRGTRKVEDVHKQVRFVIKIR